MPPFPAIRRAAWLEGDMPSEPIGRAGAFNEKV